MADLPTNFLDDILSASMGGKRRFKITNLKGTSEEVTIEDISKYDQVGSTFGASDINKTNQAVNEKFDSDDVVDPKLATEEGFAADAKLTGDALSELNKNTANINDKLVNIANVITNEQLTFSLASSTGTITSKDVFVAPASGIYFIDAYAIFAHNTNGNRFFSLGSVDLDGITCAPASGNSTAIKLNTVVYMSKGQQFFVNLRQTSGTDLNVTIKSRYSYLPL